MGTDHTCTLIDDNASKVQGKLELARLLDISARSDEAEVRRALRAELKRLHPDAGGDRSPLDVARLEALLAARDRWQLEAGDRDPADALVKVSAWFTPPPRGAEPRPGFWTRQPRATRE
jgi:hypothetical protein